MRKKSVLVMALMLAWLALILLMMFAGCGIERSEMGRTSFSPYRAAEPTKEEQKEAVRLEKSIREYQERHEAEAEELFEKEEMLSIERVLYCKEQHGEPMTDRKLERELYYDSLEEVAICVNVEAQNQGFDGMYMVACVILNWLGDPDFPDTLHGVISQPYQFSSYWDGGMQKWSVPSEDCYKAVQMALEDNRYPELLFFQEDGYSPYGTPAFKCGDHYFSTK